ncbi:hypothetical protein AYO49_01385 [Verrucomicrobiaceae bacterium SCGC AG-212-N21]|nr:hypothetical protein AYO49_01385 [Verrucomicrobiaceae bacterium SCGC AG-212-N21]
MAERNAASNAMLHRRCMKNGKSTMRSRCLKRAACLSLLLFSAGPVARAASAPDYEREVKAILREHCVSCHGPVKQKGGLRLDGAALLLKGGKHGASVTAGESARSLLIERLLSADEDERMPREARPLSATKIEVLRRWIDAGAPYPKNEIVAQSPAEHWSFQPVKATPVPKLQSTKYKMRNAIDAFVLARLEREGLQPAPAAKPMDLLRRVYLNLTGLPPTIEEQERFVRQPSGLALDNVIGELLSRPSYGERWARHWLDVARYADTNGYELDAEKPFVWRYRDYVIQSLNSDKPFNRFVIEQIAGDELPDRTAETMIATGFLRVGHWAAEPGDPDTDRYDQLDDIVSTTGQAFLGLTIGCARCHDHKFEPLSTRDYYSLVSVFNGLERPRKGRVEQTVPAGPEKLEAYIWTEPSPVPPATHVLIRGSPTRFGDLVEPAVPAVLVKHQPEFPQPDASTSRRRLGLAQWLASGENPLTARVIVNRVWQQHFGQGLVRTANDFGMMGDAPTNPELLDWLAHWFVHEAQWSLKKLHRLILTSSAWRQQAGAENGAVSFRRLEVEAIRDSMLAVSGQLNLKRLGPAMKPRIPAAAIEANTDMNKIWKPSTESEASRRTIYAFVKRGLVLPMLEVLDLADTVSSCPQRQVTTVAPQALSLFNGDFVNEQAMHFAARLVREAGPDRESQLRLAWQLALCREPTKDELAKMLEFLDQESLTEVCRVILNLNEFAYPN